MSRSSVQNGNRRLIADIDKSKTSVMLTGRAGTVYDVNIKYKQGTNWKQYSKKGFATKKDAQQHEAEMKVKLSSPTYAAVAASQSKQTVQEEGI